MRVLLAAVAGCLAGLVVAPGTGASDLSQSDEEGVDYVRFEALEGRVNRVTVTATASAGLTLHFSDGSASIHRTFGLCRRRTRHSASCPVGTNGGAVGLELGNRDDTVRLSGIRFVFDNPHDPGARGPAVPSFYVEGDLGNDVLTLGAYAEGNLVGGPGADRLRGGPHAPANLDGGPDSDVITGGGQGDRVVGGGGGDVISVAGGGADRVYCGTGVDTVRADPSDRLVGCERVVR